MIKNFIRKYLVIFSLLLLPSVALATDYHYCKCDTGGVGPAAHASCTPGTSDANDGLTPSTARITFTISQLNALVPGDRVLSCTGGKWNEISLPSSWSLLAASYANNPVILDSYVPTSGATGRPLFTKTTGVMFTLGNYNACNNPRGGYVFRNLAWHGASENFSVAPSGNFSLSVVGEIRGITLENMDIQGFRDSIQMSAKSMWDDCNATTPGVYRQFQSNMSKILLKNNHIHRNYSHGILMTGSDALVEGNLFEYNNFAGSGGVHSIYWTGGLSNLANERVTIRKNVFRYNSATATTLIDPDTGNPGDGQTCRVGNLTMRQMSGLRIEQNLVYNYAARDTCYGLNVNLGYASVTEHHKDIKIFNNTVVNPGGCGICAQSTQDVTIENNVIVMERSGQTSVSGAISTLSGSGYEGLGKVNIRNNSLYLWGGLAIQAESGSTFGAPSNQVVSNNLITYWGTGTRTCFQHDAKSTYTFFNNNLCYNATRFSQTYTTLGNEQVNCPSGTASFDCNSLRSDPLVTIPTDANGWDMSLQNGSPAVNAGSNTYCSRLTRSGVPRTGTCEIGAY